MAKCAIYCIVNLEPLFIEELEDYIPILIRQISSIKLHIKKDKKRYSQIESDFDATMRLLTDFDKTRIPEGITNRLSESHRRNALLVVEFDYGEPLKLREGQNLAELTYSNDYISYFVALEYAHEEVCDFIRSSWIIYPSFLEIDDCVAYVDGQFGAVFKSARCSFDFSAEDYIFKAFYLQEMKKDDYFQLFDAYKWHKFQMRSIYRCDFDASTKICTAICYLMTPDTDTFDPAILLWSLSGLEALLSDGRPGYVKDIVKKIHVILDMTENNDFLLDGLNQSYKMRNGLIHGSALNYVRGQRSINFDYENKIYESANFSASLLLLMARCLIKSKRKRFDFTYSLSP